MPKTSKDFPCQLTFLVPTELKIKLLALGFLSGSGRSYSVIARNLLHQAIETAVGGLSPERRKAYDEILANVRLTMTEG